MSSKTVDKSPGTTYSWLKGVPSSDTNFTGALDRADADTIREVLKDMPKEHTKTKRKVLEARLRRLEKNNPKS